MTTTTSTRKLLLIVHIVLSIGWVGALSGFVVLSMAGLISDDLVVARSAYVSMDLVNRFAIVPFAILALLTGIIQSLRTPWGLARHYWVLFKLLIIATATFMLLMKTGQISTMASVAGETSFSVDNLRELRVSIIIHAIGGVAVLLWATTLAVYKPTAETPFARKAPAWWL
jgi:hypothetical protein